MFNRPMTQGAIICVVALMVGTVHALLAPVKLWDSGGSNSPSGPQATGVQGGPGEPTPTNGGQTPAPNQTHPPVSPAPPVVPVSSPTPPSPPTQTAGNDRMISLAQFKELMAGALPLQIVDAREAGEYAQGRIGGAINIPPGEFFGKVPDAVNQRLSRDLPVVVYCGGGNCDASKLVAVRLKDLGFAQTYVYEDGYSGWTKAGEAVEK